MIQQQNCSNSIGFLILHFKRGNSNVFWDRWALIALQHKRCSDSINIALCHAWIQIFFSGGLTSDIYLCLLGVMVPAIFSVILLCKFQKFEFSRISPDTPLSFTRSTHDELPNVINFCSVGNFLHVFSIGQLKFKFHPIINRFIYHGSPLTIKNSIFQCVDKIIDRLLMIQTFVYTSHSIDMFE